MSEPTDPIERLTNGETNGGRAPGGRFAPGNPGGPGNPNAATVNKYRRRFLKEAKTSDVKKAIQVIREAMDSPKVADRLTAAKELLDRVLGKTTSTEQLERIEVLERTP